MRRVYQRPAPLTVVLVLLAACSRPAAVPLPAPPPRSWPLEVFLSSRAYQPLGMDGRGRLLATERGPAGERAVWVAPGGALAPVAPLVHRSYRALAPLAGDSVLIELAATAGGAPAALAIADASGAAAELPAPDAGGRFLGAAPDGERFWTARAAPDGHEQLVETARRLRLGRVLLDAPPGFRFAAVAPGGDRAAMVREMAPADEQVVVAGRTEGTGRLVLPTGPEGHFRPLLFSADGQRLLVAADDASDLPRLDWLELASGVRQPALATECAAVGARATGGALVAELSCDGRRVAVVAGGGDAPWRGEWPPDLVPFAALAATDGSWWLGLAGPASARDLARLVGGRQLDPLTWGLAPRLEPAALPVPRFEHLRSGAADVPLEVWRPRVPPVGAVVWLEAGSMAPSWGEFHPLFAGLAAHGIAVARLRPRGAGGFGRALAAAAGDDPVSAARDDAAAALARLRALLGAPTLPAVRVAEGALGDALGEADGAAAAPFGANLAVPASPDTSALADAGRRLLARLGVAD